MMTARCKECNRIKTSQTILARMKAALDRAKRRLDIADMEVDAARREVRDWEQRIASSKRNAKERRLKIYGPRVRARRTADQGNG